MSYNTLAFIKSGVKEKMPVVVVSPKVDGPDYVEVVADGTKTYAQMLATLYELADTSKINEKSILRVNNNICPCIEINGSDFYFGRSFAGSTVRAEMMMYKLGTTCTRITWIFNTSGNTPYDESSDTVPSGRVIKLYY